MLLSIVCIEIYRWGKNNNKTLHSNTLVMPKESDGIATAFSDGAFGYYINADDQKYWVKDIKAPYICDGTLTENMHKRKVYVSDPIGTLSCIGIALLMTAAFSGLYPLIIIILNVLNKMNTKLDVINDKIDDQTMQLEDIQSNVTTVSNKADLIFSYMTTEDTAEDIEQRFKDEKEKRNLILKQEQEKEEKLLRDRATKEYETKVQRTKQRIVIYGITCTSAFMMMIIFTFVGDKVLESYGKRHMLMEKIVGKCYAIDTSMAYLTEKQFNNPTSNLKRISSLETENSPAPLTIESKPDGSVTFYTGCQPSFKQLSTGQIWEATPQYLLQCEDIDASYLEDYNLISTHQCIGGTINGVMNVVKKVPIIGGIADSVGRWFQSIFSLSDGIKIENDEHINKENKSLIPSRMALTIQAPSPPGDATGSYELHEKYSYDRTCPYDSQRLTKTTYYWKHVASNNWKKCLKVQSPIGIVLTRTDEKGNKKTITDVIGSLVVDPFALFPMGWYTNGSYQIQAHATLDNGRSTRLLFEASESDTDKLKAHALGLLTEATSPGKIARIQEMTPISAVPECKQMIVLKNGQDFEEFQTYCNSVTVSKKEGTMAYMFKTESEKYCNIPVESSDGVKTMVRIKSNEPSTLFDITKWACDKGILEHQGKSCSPSKPYIEFTAEIINNIEGGDSIIGANGDPSTNDDIKLPFKLNMY